MRSANHSRCSMLPLLGLLFLWLALLGGSLPPGGRHNRNMNSGSFGVSRVSSCSSCLGKPASAEYLRLARAGAVMGTAIPAGTPSCGAAWRIVPSVDPSSQDNGFNGVAAISTGDAWAVGAYMPGANQHATLIQHWD